MADVPPRTSVRSSTIVLSPARAVVSAADNPAAPDPTTIASAHTVAATAPTFPLDGHLGRYPGQAWMSDGDSAATRNS